MDLLLQLWGGGFYLANKILLALAEGRPKKSKRLLKLAGWSIYILGVPAWVIILVSQQNWIAASVEAGGVPSMLFGLYNGYKRIDGSSRQFDTFAKTVTCAALAFGIGYSMFEHRGINSVTQLLEIGIMIGFLLGSYLLAKNQTFGWLFFMLMNCSTATLMFVQDKPILAIQQLLSLCFVIYGFTVAIKSNRNLY